MYALANASTAGYADVEPVMVMVLEFPAPYTR